MAAPALPVALFAATMGIASLGLAWREAALTGGFSPLAGELILALAAGVFVVLAARYLRKALTAFASVRAEFEDPIAASYFGTVTISLSLLAAGLAPYARDPAIGVWAIGALASVVLVIVLLQRWIASPRELSHITPALFIPVVGNAVAVFAAGTLGFAELGWLLFAIALLTWLTLQPLVFYRLIFHDPLPARLMPSLAILVSSPAVLASALFVLDGDTADAGVRILAFFALFLAVLVIMLTRFSWPAAYAPSWWGYTFPAAALAGAFARCNATVHSPLSAALAWITLVAASAIVAYVGARSIPAWIRR